MTTLQSGHQVVAIETTCVDPTCVFKIDLDTEKNLGLTCFEPRNNIFMRVFYNRPYWLKSTMFMHPVERVQQNILIEIEDEYIHFTDFEGNTEYPIYHLDMTFGVTLTWIGINLGNVMWEQGSTRLRTAKSPGLDGYGVLHLSKYKTRYNRHRLIPTVAGDVIVYGELTSEDACAGTKASLSITVQEDCDIKYSGDNEVTIITKNFITGQIIPNAHVYIGGVYKGKTNSSGALYAGRYKSGKYPLRITAHGYTNTDRDLLGNDEIIVTESPEDV